MISSPGPGPHPLAWLALFVALSVGATLASARHLVDVPLRAAQQVVAPLQTGASRIGRAVGSITSGWDELNRLRAENAALRRTVDELTQEAVNLRAAELENRDLREQLRYAQGHQALAPLPAEVIGFDASGLFGYAIVNRGGDDKLDDGMTVLSTAGLVGRIVSHNARTSKVLLITNPSSSVNAVVQGNPGATGVVNGSADGHLVMRYIPQSEPVKVNDLVVTSGLGGAFPRDLAIGRIAHVQSRDVDVFQEAVVETFADFGTLRQVLIATAFTPLKL
jgi:rod shape-determining protein MreC